MRSFDFVRMAHFAQDDSGGFVQDSRSGPEETDKSSYWEIESIDES